MAESSPVDQDLQRLEAELKRLEAEYNMFFSGRLARPPWETRRRVEALVKQYNRAHIQNFGHRFRFTTLQARFATLAELWDRGLRAREEGRPGPFAARRPEHPAAPAPPLDRILHVTTFQDPTHEMDRLMELYQSLSTARRDNGQDSVPFHRFSDLVKSQVCKLQASGGSEVTFRVMLKDGRVSFTARALTGVKK